MEQSLSLRRPSTPEEIIWKEGRVTLALAQLAIRRQAQKLSEAEYGVYNMDLAPYRLDDIEAACLQIGREARGEGATAFPSVGALVDRVKSVASHRRDREEAEEREREVQYVKDHPNEVSPFDFKGALAAWEAKRSLK